jgi:DNA invertase Pin-like site-specific DNA recombinase
LLPRKTKAIAGKRKGAPNLMKRVVLYTRVSSSDQHTETQLCDLRPLANARGYEIVGEYTDTISGAKAKRPGLDKLMSDARRGRFDIVMVWAFDRMARSVMLAPI